MTNQLCIIMKIKVNDLVKNEVTRSGKQKKNIAEEIGISRNQLNNILAEPEMEMKYVVKIGKSIRHDFTKDLPQLASFVTDDDAVEYDTLNSNQLKNELLELQRKYTKLQDDYISTLKDLLDCQRQIALK
jgi:hypothetical protein